VARPEDVAPAIVFLTSDRPRVAIGRPVFVDGELADRW
jgi:hypothetical protein